MDSIVFVAILLTLVILTAINLVIFGTILARINAFRRAFYEFITPAEAGGKSALGDFVDMVSYSIGHSAFTQVRSMGAAAESARVRGERTVDAAVSQDLLAQANPVLAAIIDSMPNLRKIVSRNPALADYALEKIMSRAMAQGPPAHQPSDNGNNATTISIT